MINGNMDYDYELNELEEGYVHIKCGQKVHDSAKLEYVINYRVIKVYPSIYAKMKKQGAFAQFHSTEVLHMPGGKKEVKDVVDVLIGLKSDYKLLYNADAPEGLTEAELKAAIKEMAVTRKDEVRELYVDTTNEKAGTKGTLTLLKELKELEA